MGTPVRPYTRPVTGRVFRRSLDPDPPVAVEARDATIRDADGPGVPRRRRRRDRRQRRPRPASRSPASMAEQAGRLAYAHGSAFTTEPLEALRRGGRAAACRSTTRRSTRSSGGSEAIETALKLARAYHLARGEPDRGSSSPAGAATTATRSGRSTCPGGRRCAGRTRPGSGGSATCRRPTRTAAGEPGAHALGDGAGARRRAGARDRGGRTRARSPPSSPSRSSGATLAAAVPPDDYWPAIAEVCRRHGVLLIADEVMTGFGRTGRWFGLDHWGVRADILVAAKGATSRLLAVRVRRGVAARSTTTVDGAGRVRPRLHVLARAGRRGGRARGAAHPRDEDLVEASAAQGRAARGRCSTSGLGEHPAVGEIRGPGPDGRHRARRGPRDPRAVPARRARRPRRVVRGRSRATACCVYSGTGNADGVDGDTILLGPPFVVTDDELDRIADGVADAIDGRDGGVAGGRRRGSARQPAPAGGPRAGAAPPNTTSIERQERSPSVGPRSRPRRAGRAGRRTRPASPAAAATAADRRDEQEREAEAERAQPGPRSMPVAGQYVPGAASAVMNAPA